MPSEFELEPSSTLWANLNRTLPSAPVGLMYAHKHLSAARPRCIRVPLPTDLLVVNNHWQFLKSGDENMYFYSAHFEDRAYRVVRIVAVIDV